MDNQASSPGKVMIVEDDMLLSLVEERLIEKLGYEVVGKAESGEEALQMFDELNPDLILMDIVLKGEMDGIEVMEKIRETSEVPVIYLSGNSDQYYYQRARQTQLTEYLVKPVTTEDLAVPLKKVFSEKNSSVTAASNVKPLRSDNRRLITQSA